jgi:hypothetical protein
LVIGAISLFSLTSINSYSDRLSKVSLKEWQLAGNIENTGREIGYNLLSYTRDSDETAWQNVQEGLVDLKSKVDSATVVANETS